MGKEFLELYDIYQILWENVTDITFFWECFWEDRQDFGVLLPLAVLMQIFGSLLIIVVNIAMFFLVTAIWIIALFCEYAYRFAVKYRLKEKAAYALRLLVAQIGEKIKASGRNLSPLANTYTKEWVADMLWNILAINWKPLEITRPAAVCDILPTQKPVVQMENGFPTYYFICQHPSGTAANIDGIQKILQMKIGQYLQCHCYNLQTYFLDMPVIHVLRVTEDGYHYGCYGIYLMLVDNNHKYGYAKNLGKDRFIGTNGNIYDEDF